MEGLLIIVVGAIVLIIVSYPFHSWFKIKRAEGGTFDPGPSRC